MASHLLIQATLIPANLLTGRSLQAHRPRLLSRLQHPASPHISGTTEQNSIGCNYLADTLSINKAVSSGTALLFDSAYVYNYFRRKQAFLPQKLRKKSEILRIPQESEIFPQFLRKNPQILRKHTVSA